MDPTDDLIGTLPDAGANPGALGAMEKGLRQATGDDQAELDDVKCWQQKYKTARAFDKAARIQYARDRKYAAGLADPNWASDANLIGAFIDILVSFLFAQNPDVSTRPAEHVDETPDINMTKFAKTMELVVSKLWKQGKLKPAGKRWVRAALSTGIGWLKGTFLTDKRPAPQLEQQLSTQQDQFARIQAAQAELADGENGEDLALQQRQIQDSMNGLNAKLQKQTRYGLMCDLARSEDIQVSLDVSDITMYDQADWMSIDIYSTHDSLKSRFERLDEDDLKSATAYYQRNVALKGDGEEQVLGDNSQDIGQFSRDMPDGQASGSGKAERFAKIVEIWDRKNQLVRTTVDGVKKWAVEPYPPPQATERFYPFFGLWFYPIDGMRHPQSLAWRLRKLQDEYSGTRSAQVLTRQRSVPGILFNAGGLDPVDAKKLEQGVHGEFTALQGTAGTPVQNLFAQKPQPTYNAELYNTEPTLSDMERISGVQEALSQGASSANEPKTATEASIEHQGFQSRTGNDRDQLETALDDLANYTGECAIQECPVSWVIRVAGKNAFWLGPDDTKVDPMTGEKSVTPGMDVEDLLTMVELQIDAGTTGKPNSAADKANWATILPLLEKSVVQIRQYQTMDPDLALILIRILRETLKRMDDRLDLEEFIPPPPQPMAPAIDPATGLPIPGAPGAPGLPGAPAAPLQSAIPIAPAAAVPGVPGATPPI